MIVIVGPTAVGKSEFARQIASESGGEIIVADSRQVYRGMDIGTAKPTARQRARFAYHLLDLIGPQRSFSAGDFVRHADAAIAEIRARGSRPIVEGGTGFYIKALLFGLMPAPTADTKIRKSLAAIAAREGKGALHERLAQIDPEAARKIHPNDLSKVIRALEVQRLTGTPISAIQRRHGFSRPRYRAQIIGISRPREELYRRIEQRVEDQIAAGLFKEVEGLLCSGVSPDAPGMRALGYRQIVPAVLGKAMLQECVKILKRDTKRYAKRQMTWFSAQPGIRWIDPKEAQIRQTGKNKDQTPRSSKGLGTPWPPC